MSIDSIKFTECNSSYCNKHYIKQRILCKLHNKVQGFITVTEKGDISFSFGKPSQASYIAFYVSSIEEAKNRLVGYISNREETLQNRTIVVQ